MREEILASVARTGFVCAYADEAENDNRLRSASAGGDWFDVVPEIECPEADTWAEEVGAHAESCVGSLERMAKTWMLSSGCDLERFGHCLAMMYLGHGVGLDDDCSWGSGWVCPQLGYIEFYPDPRTFQENE